jgi:ATP-dependent phosphoenolpyruvate carboxykinase
MLRNCINKCFYQQLKKNLVEHFGIKTPLIQRNLKYFNYLYRISEYYEGSSITNPADPETKRSCMADSGAFVAYSGLKSGRSPKDKRIVSDAIR